MFGNVVNRTRLRDLIKTDHLGLSPFDPNKMRIIHYPLSPIRVYTRGDILQNKTIELKLHHEFKNYKVFELPPNEYVIIEIKEHIEMKKPGIIGHFITPSAFIERGIGLVAGRIEYPYGIENESVRFGIKNNLNVKNYIYYDDKIAYVYFVDLLSMREDKEDLSYRLTREELMMFEQWRRRKLRIEDSGVPFDNDDEED